MPKAWIRVSDRHNEQAHRGAFHEAGHAVAAVLERVEFQYVMLHPGGTADDPNFGGHLAPNVSLAEALELPAADRRALIRVGFAGGAAEHRWRHLSGRYPSFTQWLHSFQGDAKYVDSLAESLEPDEVPREALRQACWTETWAAICSDTTWVAVRGLAGVLLARGSLEGADARRLVLDFLAG